MNSYQPPLQRLIEAARQARDDREAAAPYGFATRVAALAMSAERPMASMFEQISLRAMGVACLLAVTAVASNYSSVVNLFHQDETPPVADDPVAVLVDIAS